MWIYLIYSTRAKCHCTGTSLTRLALDALVISGVLVREAFGGASAVLRVEDLVAGADLVGVQFEESGDARLALDAAVRVPSRRVLGARPFDVPAERTVREELRRRVVDGLLAVELSEGLEFGGRVCADLGGWIVELLDAAYA